MTTKKPMRVRREVLLGAGGALVAAVGWAQGASQPASALQTRLAATLLVSDNLSGGVEAPDGGALLTVSPGVRLGVRRSEFDVSLDYGLNLMTPWRLRQTLPERMTHQLDARTRWHQDSAGLEIQGTAGIRQQALSAFGPQSVGVGRSATPFNQSQVYSASLLPAWTFSLGSLGDVRLDHRTTATNTKDSVVGDAVSQESGFALGNSRSPRLGWQVRVSQATQRPQQGLRTQTDRASLSANWRPDTDWQFHAQLGRERSNVRRLGVERGATYGLGANWSPTPRTMVSAKWDHRVFGRTYSLALNQRFRRATISLSESRGLTEPGVLGAVAARTHYELLFAQLAAEEPDPLRRDLLVRQRLEQLGLAPDAIASNGIVSSRPTLTRQRVLAGTWLTPRTSWTLSLSDSLSTRFSQAADGLDDFSLSSYVRLRGLSLGSTYRFSPTNNVGLAFQWQRNEGDRAALATQSRAASLNWTARLGARQQLSVVLRHSEFESPPRPQEDNTLVLSYLMQF